ncbi:PEP-CTERM sorting domain-containing protein [Sphingomonas sp. AP4-R1]|uniref:NF038129 family PEP-CTERM protein n=1 Tax=Sphingomonas sp. AP4-R1 TaxID=2735134 RepID=UPI0014939802|nr:NF038129 family PEP-CTERM protein [Sphingomonas sp. AP4-R1]QJU56575.1 PEP-CTERM sorting domain-containing protein [Sphingomonas sp. AP4-R1]
MKTIFAAALAALALGTSAGAAVTYHVTVDTSSQIGKAGYIDLQFGAGCLGGGCNPQLATALVSGFTTDGTLQPFDGNDPNDLAEGTTGTLPTGVSFDNQTFTPSDFSQAIIFGSSLSFAVTLSGPAIESPLNDGGNYVGTAFLFDFGNADFSDFYFSQNDGGPFGFLAGALHIQQDGSVLVVANPSSQDYTQSSGLSFTTITAASDVPEPASWAMMLAGFGLVGGTMRRRKLTVSFA